MQTRLETLGYNSQVFQSHMKAKVRQLRSELKTVKKGTRTMSEYLLRIKTIVDSLVAVGDSILDQDHIDSILDGLQKNLIRL